jgi:hypothetical protein
MSGSETAPVATLGDVQLAGQGLSPTPLQVSDAVTVRRPCPVSGMLEQVSVHQGMALNIGDVLSSSAYCSGVDVMFGSRVEPLVGRGLVAHELTHVVQQGQPRATPVNNAAIDAPAAPQQRGGEAP